MRSPASFPPHVTLVAESLRRLRPPPYPLSFPEPARSASEVAAAMAWRLRPSEAGDTPPTWLRAEQVTAFRRLLSVLRRHRGALLAEPAGTGKTWIALAVAQAWPSALAVVPAVTRHQWLAASARTGVPITLQTHDGWSRAPRPLAEEFVIIDEAHGFRNPATRRYRHLAPRLVGRSVLLLTATPVVNRTEDLLHLLLLGVPDDALQGIGLRSLTAAMSTRRPGGTAQRPRAMSPAQRTRRPAQAALDLPTALGHLVVAGTTSDAPATTRPRAAMTSRPAGSAEEQLARKVIRAVDGLTVCDASPVRRLVHGVFLGAAASSLAALAATMNRYRHLLLQTRDAMARGAPLGRQALRRVLGSEVDQLVFWELLGVEPGDAAGVELRIDDLSRLEPMLSLTRGSDPKLHRLSAELQRGQVTVVFARYRATVDWLRRTLTPSSRIAWLSGVMAGIGPTRLPRERVLSWFGPSAPEHALAPRVLVSTDVAAEGVDLQRASCVVHVDLPWTMVRVEQRQGRIERIGSRHAEVEAVHLLPATAYERRLRQLTLLRHKAGLPRRLGLGDALDGVRRWDAALLALDRGQRVFGCAAARSAQLSALALCAVDRGDAGTDGWCLALPRGGRWSDDPGLVLGGLQEAHRHRTEVPPQPAECLPLLASLSTTVAARAQLLNGVRWEGESLDADRRRALARVRGCATRALRDRSPGLIALAERGLRFLSRGHTAGESACISQLAHTPDADLMATLARMPDSPIHGPPRVRLEALILFRGP